MGMDLGSGFCGQISPENPPQTLPRITRIRRIAEIAQIAKKSKLKNLTADNTDNADLHGSKNIVEMRWPFRRER
jgi:hypothetical protein